MADSTNRVLAGALDALMRRAEERASEESRYGERTGPNTFKRYEDGVLISTLVAGSLAYALANVDLAALS